MGERLGKMSSEEVGPVRGNKGRGSREVMENEGW